MPYSRTISAKSGGPLSFSVKGEFTKATVHVGGVSRAEVTLSTADGEDSPSVKAIDRAAWSSRNSWDHLEVPEVPGMPGAGGVTSTVYQSGGSMIVRQSGGAVAGSLTGVMMTGGGGDIVVNGVRITPELLQEAAKKQGVQTSTGIELVVRLPESSSLKVETGHSPFAVEGAALQEVIFKARNGDLLLDVPVKSVEFDSHNGDLRSDRQISALEADTHNGNISVGHLHGSGSATAHNGNIYLVAMASGTVRAKAHNGNVVVEDPNGLYQRGELKVKASAHNGNVRAPR
jgi:hypothetical protein